MRIIYDGPEEDWDEAMTLMSREIMHWRDRYNRVGWGWSYGPYSHGGKARYFVRRIKDGLSIKRLAQPVPPPLRANPIGGSTWRLMPPDRLAILPP